MRTPAKKCLKRIITLMLTALLIVPLFCGLELSAASTTNKLTLLEGTDNATSYYIIDSGKSGPVVMITAGVHGSERAPIQAAEKIADWSINKGVLIVVPRCHIQAVNASTRTSGGVDLNRTFPQSAGGKADSPIATALLELVKKEKVDWLMDLHEGTDYSQVSSTSVGQSIIYMPGSKGSEEFASALAKTLNKKLSGSDEFSLLKYPVKGSLARSAADIHDVRSLIFETCRQDTMANRVDLATSAVNELLQYTGLK